MYFKSEYILNLIKEAHIKYLLPFANSVSLVFIEIKLLPVYIHKSENLLISFSDATSHK